MATQAPPPTPYSLLLIVRDIIGAVDERARQCNRRWGVNRLPLLVPIEWLEKFRRQKLKWQQACLDSGAFPTVETTEAVRKQGEAMLRAFDKLEEIASDAGHDLAPLYQWEFELSDGTPVILVRDRSEIGRVDPKGRTCQIWALDEVADIIEKFPLLATAKQCFPGAETFPIRTDPVVIGALDDSLDDLPF